MTDIARKNPNINNINMSSSGDVTGCFQISFLKTKELNTKAGHCFYFVFSNDKVSCLNEKIAELVAQNGFSFMGPELKREKSKNLHLETFEILFSFETATLTTYSFEC